MDVYAQIVEKIIEGQEAIIGPVAVEQAELVPHLQLDWPNHKVVIDGEPVEVINKLIEQYKELFGQISVEVSKEAVAPLLRQLNPEKMPPALKA